MRPATRGMFMRTASASCSLAAKAFALAVLAGFTFSATTADAKPRKRHHVERQKPRKAADNTSESNDDGVRWRYGSAAIMVDANTGKVLYAQNPDALRHPASVTKVMTLYLLFEQLEAGKLKLTSDLEVSSKAASQSPSKLGLKPGSTIEVEDAIKAIVTRSANDVAVVIAENIGGSEANFGRMMTAKARALGMSRTTFVNASGLPNQRQVTTARDLSILGRAIQERFPKKYKYFATRSFYYRGERIGNHNRLLGRVEGVDGIKTGYTRASGFNLLTNVERDGRHLVGVVLGGSSGRSRDNRMAELISDYLPKAYAGGQMVAKITENTSLAAILPEARPKELTEGAPLPLRADRDAIAVDEQTEKVVALLSTPVAPLPRRAPAPPVATPAAYAEPVAPETAPALSATPAVAAIENVAPRAQAEPLVTASIPAPQARSGATASAKPTAQVGSADPIKPTTVQTISVQRPVMTAALTSSLAPPTKELGYVGPTDVSRLMPPATAKAPAAGRGVPATAKAAAAAPPKPATRHVTLPEPTPEELARYEASVWPVFDDEPEDVAQAKPAKPVRTASLAPTPAPRSTPPAPRNTPKPASAHSGWVIQIGAFDAERDARASLDLARAKAKSVLGNADPYTEAVTKGSTQLYRARFAGLDEKTAKKACRLLQRNDFACMTLRN